MNGDVRIFGREPALWIAVIEAVLGLCAVFGWFDLTTEQVGLWMGVVIAIGAVITSWLTTGTLLSALVGALQAFVALAIGYGFTLSPEATAALIGVLTAMFAFVNRAQNSPADVKMLVAA